MTKENITLSKRSLIWHWKNNKILRVSISISTFIAIILGFFFLVIQPIIIPYINYLLEPHKELEIDTTKISSLDFSI